MSLGRCRLEDQPPDPDQVGSGLHEVALRQPARRLGVPAEQQLVLSRPPAPGTGPVRGLGSRCPAAAGPPSAPGPARSAVTPSRCADRVEPADDLRTGLHQGPVVIGRPLVDHRNPRTVRGEVGWRCPCTGAGPAPCRGRGSRARRRRDRPRRAATGRTGRSPRRRRARSRGGPSCRGCRRPDRGGRRAPPLGRTNRPVAVVGSPCGVRVRYVRR